jgi:CheY-like chemotaxis protein
MLLDLFATSGHIDRCWRNNHRLSKADLPIVALTAAEEVNRMQLPEAGFSGTATKPLSRASLTSLLQQHLPCLNTELQPALNGNHG